MSGADGTFIDFERTPRYRLGDLNLTPLIDVLFILIVFFMLTTTFMRLESLELGLPSSGAPMMEKDDRVHLFVYASGDMALGQRKLSQEELDASLARLIAKDAGTKIMVLTADGVTMQQLVGVMDRVYMLGGKSLFVRKWDNAPTPAPMPVAAAPAPAASKEDVNAIEIFRAEDVKRPAISKKPSLARRPDIRDLWGE